MTLDGWITLRNFLSDKFNQDELDALVFDLGINDVSLRKTTRLEYILDLIHHFQYASFDNGVNVIVLLDYILKQRPSAEGAEALVQLREQISIAEIHYSQINTTRLDYSLHPFEANLPITSSRLLPLGSRMLYVPNPVFTGREDEIRELATEFKAFKFIAITAPAGVGKTQIAIEFANRYGRYFASVHWLSMANAADVENEIARCGEIMGVKGSNQDEIVKATRSAWESDLPRLLIFDNCEQEALFTEYMPHIGGSRVLITRRNSKWGAWVSAMIHDCRLKTLPRKESIALLRRMNPKLQLDKSTAAVLNAISEELGDLPLALHNVGSSIFMLGEDIPLIAILEELKRFGVQADAIEGNSTTELSDTPTGHIRSVTGTLLISLDQLRTEQPSDVLAVKLLARAACFAPGEPFPRELLRKTVRADLKDIAVSLSRLDYLTPFYPHKSHLTSNKVHHSHPKSTKPICHLFPCQQWPSNER